MGTIIGSKKFSVIPTSSSPHRFSYEGVEYKVEFEWKEGLVKLCLEPDNKLIEVNLLYYLESQNYAGTPFTTDPITGKNNIASIIEKQIKEGVDLESVKYNCLN